MNISVGNKRNIYILLSNTGTLLNKTIRFYTKAPYNHTSLSIDQSLTEVYSFGRKMPTNPFIGGFVREDLNGIYSHFKDTTCAILSLEVDVKTYKKILGNIERFNIEKDKYKYNLVGLFGVALNRPINRENAYFCSQFIATILEMSGVKLFYKPPGLVTPQDFHINTKLKLVYEGRLLDYAPQLSYSVTKNYGFRTLPIRIKNTLSKYV